MIELPIDKYSPEIIKKFKEIEGIVLSCSDQVESKLWAKLPSYYVGEKFVRLIPFKDHINIEASAIKNYSDKLDGYVLSQKGMLKISLEQPIPTETLRDIFKDTFTKQGRNNYA
ncbi:MAG: DUF1801 domain-containing protein [Clostridia bacterium]|nr:DUF1801 domain-containing protein [Clostridia bacterium]